MEGNEKVYSCLEPRGRALEKPRVPLTAPRLTDLTGKNVLVVMRESFPNVMPEVHKELLNQVPGINLVWWDFEKNGGLTVEQANEAKANAAVVGVGY